MSNYYAKTQQFSNGYGLSIICKDGISYGSEEGYFEVALLNSESNLIYDESIKIQLSPDRVVNFQDVIGYLDFDEVSAISSVVRSLPNKIKDISYLDKDIICYLDSDDLIDILR